MSSRLQRARAGVEEESETRPVTTLTEYRFRAPIASGELLATWIAFWRALPFAQRLRR